MPVWRAVIAGALFGLTSAIRVAPGSPCSNTCGNVLDATTPADLVCSDSSWGASAGLVFQGCLDCELGSTYVSSGQYSIAGSTDLQWLLYNARYAVSYCVFGLPAGYATSSPCTTSHACLPLQAAIATGNLSSSSGPFDYCAAWDTTSVDQCNTCLRAGNDMILANLITLLDAGCIQQPVSGTTISVAGEPFSSTIVVETTASPSLSPQYNTVPSFPLIASVGIAVSALVVLLFMVGCCIIWNGKRRRRAYLRRFKNGRTDDRWTNPTVKVDMYESPTSLKPLRTWNDSPMSANTSTRYWSPYSSPVSPEDGLALRPQPWPIHTSFADPSSMPSPVSATTLVPDSDMAIGMALGNNNLSDNQSAPARKGKRRLTEESYEMQDVGDSTGAGAGPGAAQGQQIYIGAGRGATRAPARIALSPDSYTSLNRHLVARSSTQDDLMRGQAI